MMIGNLFSRYAACLYFILMHSLIVGDAASSADGHEPAIGHVHDGMIPTDKAISMFRSRIQSDTDFRNRTILGRLLLRKAKEMGDLKSFGDAKSILREAVDINSDSAESKFYLAEALAACHDFAGSRDLLAPLVESHPENTAYLAALGDAQLHIGQYAQADKSYARLAELSQAPAVLSRLAHLDFLHGRADESLRRLAEAAELAVEFDLPLREQAWYRWRLGDVQLSQGQIDAATGSFEEALHLNPNDTAAMMGTAKVLAARGDSTEAIKFVRRLVNRHPAPPTMAYLAKLHGNVGNDQQQQRWLSEADAAMGDEAKIAAAPHYREYAMFLADNRRRTKDAVAMARKDAELRQDIYSDDALAWTNYAEGNVDVAAKHIERALRLGTRDASLHDHAACIYEAIGQTDIANEHRKRILEINPFHTSLQNAELEKTVRQR